LIVEIGPNPESGFSVGPFSTIMGESRAPGELAAVRAPRAAESRRRYERHGGGKLAAVRAGGWQNAAVTDDGSRMLVTRTRLVSDLAALGVRPGSLLVVHSSLKSLGFVVGGASAVVLALLEAVGPEGTIVVPTHTPDNSDPAGWQHPPVPQEWWAVIRSEMPGFDLDATPSRHMGAIAEAVRTWPGAWRSNHPHVSFAALGADAEEVTAGHRLDDMLGDTSPIGQVYARDGDVLLLGVGHDSNTSLHLGEYRVPAPATVPHGASVLVDGGSAWVWWTDVNVDADDFAELGADLEATGAVRIGTVGEATSRLMRQRAAVDFAAGWLAEHRPALAGD
jgi:aminoglycoside 3-N-acetyltransferase